MSTAAEFRQSIAPAIPKIIALLADEDGYVRRKAAALLGQFSVQGKVHNMVIGMADNDCS